MIVIDHRTKHYLTRLAIRDINIFEYCTEKSLYKGLYKGITGNFDFDFLHKYQSDLDDSFYIRVVINWPTYYAIINKTIHHINIFDISGKFLDEGLYKRP